MTPEPQIPGKDLDSSVARLHRSIPEIGETFGWLGRYPKEVSRRRKELTAVLESLNLFFDYSHVNEDYYPHVNELRNMVSWRHLPTLEEVVRLGRDEHTSELSSEDILGGIGKAFSENELQPPWCRFPLRMAENPTKLASGLIIGGYGLLMEKYFRREGLASTFVLAFTEVLMGKHQDLGLAWDVLDWMEVGRGTYPPKVRERIGRLRQSSSS